MEGVGNPQRAVDLAGGQQLAPNLGHDFQAAWRHARRIELGEPLQPRRVVSHSRRGSERLDWKVASYWAIIAVNGPAHGANSQELLIQLEDLSAAIGNWRARTGPTYLCLAAALADAAAQGHLAIGSRLPAERALAGHLGVSRGTVVAAYDALRAQRIARTRQGSGTVLLAGARATPPRRSPLLSLLVEGRRAPIDMAIGAPDIELPDLSVSLRDAASLAPSHGYAPLGIAPLREALADRMTRDGVPTSCEQIVVTSGGQGALSLIAATLLRPGDRVLVEAPTYPAAIEVFASSGAIVEGLDRDQAGIVPDALERAVARGPVRLLYVIPTCHNPTGGVMSEIRRREVSAIAQRRGITIVEDTVLEPMLLAGPAPPAICSIEPTGVLTIGSLSKSVWGGLRVGWIRARPRPSCASAASRRRRTWAARF